MVPPPVTFANVIKTCIASRLLSLHGTTRGLCLSVLQLKANVNGECKCRTLHERPMASSTCPLPIPKRTCSGCGTIQAMGSLCPTKSMQVSSHIVCSQFHKEFAVDVGCYHFLYDPGPAPPMSVLQLKENFNSECQCHASTTRASSARFSTTQVAVIACSPRGCTTRGSYACLLCNSKNTCSASRLLSTGCCGTACMTRELCLTVLQ